MTATKPLEKMEDSESYGALRERGRERGLASTLVCASIEQSKAQDSGDFNLGLSFSYSHILYYVDGSSEG